MSTAKRRMISLSEQTYQELKLLGTAGESFDKVISKKILSRKEKAKESKRKEGIAQL